MCTGRRRNDQDYCYTWRTNTVDDRNRNSLIASNVKRNDNDKKNRSKLTDKRKFIRSNCSETEENEIEINLFDVCLRVGDVAQTQCSSILSTLTTSLFMWLLRHEVHRWWFIVAFTFSFDTSTTSNINITTERVVCIYFERFFSKNLK